LFEDKFSTTKDFGVRLGAIEFKYISLKDNVILISNFSEEEFREVVWQYDGSKSPGHMSLTLTL